MNKRELIEHINNTLFDKLKDTLFTEPTLLIKESAKDNKTTITFETEQVGVLVGGMLKKFEKVTVPQFVADWIEKARKSGGDLEDLFDDIVYEQDHIEWFREEENMNLVARAWLDGFEIEKEKRFLVKVKGVDSRTNYLYYGEGSKTWLFKTKLIDGLFRKSHTRKELEQNNFGWVFECPGIEVEEVG